MAASPAVISTPASIGRSLPLGRDTPHRVRPMNYHDRPLASSEGLDRWRENAERRERELAAEREREQRHRDERAAAIESQQVQELRAQMGAEIAELRVELTECQQALVEAGDHIIARLTQDAEFYKKMITECVETRALVIEGRLKGEIAQQIGKLEGYLDGLKMLLEPGMAKRLRQREREQHRQAGAGDQSTPRREIN
jgi:hypothetical protein